MSYDPYMDRMMAMHTGSPFGSPNRFRGPDGRLSINVRVVAEDSHIIELEITDTRTGDRCRMSHALSPIYHPDFFGGGDSSKESIKTSTQNLSLLLL